MLTRFKWKSIPDVKILDFSSEQPQGALTSHIVYHTHINDGPDRWIVRKRWSEFKDMNEELKSEFKDYLSILPPFLSITVSPIAPSADSLRQRQKALQSYVQSLIFIGPVLHTTILRAFLQPPDPAAAATVGASRRDPDAAQAFLLPPPPMDLIIPAQLLINSSSHKKPELHEDDFELLDIDDDDDDPEAAAQRNAELELEDALSGLLSDVESESFSMDRPAPRGHKRRRSRLRGPPPQQQHQSNNNGGVEIEMDSFSQALSPAPVRHSEPSNNMKTGLKSDDLIHLQTLISSVKEKLAFYSSFRAAHCASPDSSYFVYAQTQHRFSSSIVESKEEVRLLVQLASALERAAQNAAPADHSNPPESLSRSAMEDLLHDPLSDSEETRPNASQPQNSVPKPPRNPWMEPGSLSRYLASCAAVVNESLRWCSKFVELADNAAVKVAEKTTLVDSLVAQSELLLSRWLDGDQGAEQVENIKQKYSALQEELNALDFADSPDDSKPHSQVVEKLRSARDFLASTCSFLSEC